MRLNEKIHIKGLAQYQAFSKGLINNGRYGV